MNVKWFALIAILAAVLALQTSALTPVASAAEKDYVPYSFTLTPAQCPDLHVTIQGAGQYYFRINQRTDKNGVTRQVINSSAKGIATDNTGQTYRYNYSNHLLAIVPAAPPYQFKFEDKFNLVGAGSGQQLHIHVVFFITDVNGDGPFTPDDIVKAIGQHGNFACDPI